MKELRTIWSELSEAKQKAKGPEMYHSRETFCCMLGLYGDNYNTHGCGLQSSE